MITLKGQVVLRMKNFHFIRFVKIIQTLIIIITLIFITSITSCRTYFRHVGALMEI